MTGVDANGGRDGGSRRAGGPGTARRGVGLVAQLRGPAQLTRCDEIPWTLEGQSAAAEALSVLWIVVAELARERRKAVEDEDPAA